MSGASTPMNPPENPFAGQGAVLLDIGGDIGALVVTMPADMEGVEVEIRPASASLRSVPDHDHAHNHDDHEHGHSHGGEHRQHVAVVNRPVQDKIVPSLVFPDLVEGRYLLSLKGEDEVVLEVAVTGGEVTTADWPA